MTRYIYFKESTQHAALLFGLSVIALSVVIGLLAGHYKPTTYLVPAGTSALVTDNVIALGFLIGLSPIALVNYLNHRYLKSVEKNIPRFLREILQSTDSGLVLPNALLQASKSDYGPISLEMGIALTKFSLGQDFGTSIMDAAMRLRHPQAPQVALILSEAYASGGRTHEVLSSSVSLFNSLEQYEEQKQSELRPYTQLVYISVGIYLVIAYIIITQFMSKLEQIASAPNIFSPSGPAVNFASHPFNLSIPPIAYFISIFFLSALLESIFAGIVAGKIVESRALSGLRHSLILIVITILIFNLPL